MTELPEGALPIGEIIIRYYLDDDGAPMIQIDLPDTDSVPAVVQLGMLDLARDSILHGPDDEDEEDA
jgi:hypothetical protein